LLMAKSSKKVVSLVTLQVCYIIYRFFLSFI
jgi:hypothetical protein